MIAGIYFLQDLFLIPTKYSVVLAYMKTVKQFKLCSRMLDTFSTQRINKNQILTK